MEAENLNYKIIAAAVLGVLGGLLLASYLGSQDRDKSLSEHLASLSKILKQLEGINSVEAENLKERVENILTTIESTYGNAKE